MGLLLTLAWRNVWRNRLRSAIMVAATVFGLLGVVLAIGFMQAMIDNMVANAIRYETAHLQIHERRFTLNEELAAFLPGADALAARIRALPEVAGVAVRQVVEGLAASPAATRGVRIHGVNPAAEARVNAIAEAVVAGTALDPAARNRVLLGRRLAERLDLRVGSKVVLTFSDRRGELTGAAFRVAGLFATPSSGFDEGNVFVRRADLARYTGLAEAHEVLVRLAAGSALAALRAQVEALARAQAGPGAEVRDWSEVRPLIAAMTGTIETSNAIVMVIYVLALGLGIVNVMLMAVFERTRELGVLMALGTTPGRLLALIGLESLLLGAAGALAGLAVSAVALAALGRVGLPLGALAEGLASFGVDTVLYPRLEPAAYLWLLALVLAASALAALYPARQVLRLRPAEALARRQ